MVRRLLLAFLHWTHQLALAVWLGGILMLGAVAAPAVFRTAKDLGDTRAGTPLYDFAGLAAGEIFRRLNHVSLAAGVVLLLAGLAAAALEGMPAGPVRLRAALVAAAWGIAAWLTLAFFPRLLEAREAGQVELFGALHRAYSRWVLAQALLLLGAAAATAWLGARPSGAAAGERAAEGDVPLAGAPRGMPGAPVPGA